MRIAIEACRTCLVALPWDRAGRVPDASPLRQQIPRLMVPPEVWLPWSESPQPASPTSAPDKRRSIAGHRPQALPVLPPPYP